MKILIVRLFPYEININNYNVQEIGLAKALVKEGNQCDIVFYTKGKEKREIINVDNKKINIFWIKGYNILKNGLYGKKLLKLAQNYDIIQSSEYDQIYNLKLTKKFPNKVVIYHGPYYSEFNKGYNLKCKLFDKFFLTNRYRKVPFITKSELASEFLRKKGFENVTTVGVGLDKDKIQDSNNVESLISRTNNNEKWLLYIGKIEERRNIIFLVKVLKRLKDENKNVKLILIGNGRKEYKEKVFDFAKSLGVFDSIIYKEKIQQNEISKIYKKCDIFLLPTEYEIFGMVLLEAMYFNLPVITTLNGGSSVLIKNRENGIIINLNEDEWVKNINELLENKDFRENLAKKASLTIKEEFLWDKLVYRFINIYKQTKEKIRRNNRCLKK